MKFNRVIKNKCSFNDLKQRKKAYFQLNASLNTMLHKFKRPINFALNTLY